jgi:hypothetical protein
MRVKRLSIRSVALPLRDRQIALSPRLQVARESRFDAAGTDFRRLSECDASRTSEDCTMEFRSTLSSETSNTRTAVLRASLLGRGSVPAVA